MRWQDECRDNLHIRRYYRIICRNACNYYYDKKRIYNLIEYLNLGLHSSYFVVLFNNFKK